MMIMGIDNVWIEGEKNKKNKKGVNKIIKKREGKYYNIILKY